MLKIIALRDIHEIKLNIAEFDIHGVTSLDSVPITGYDTMKKEDQLIISCGCNTVKG